VLFTVKKKICSLEKRGSYIGGFLTVSPLWLNYIYKCC
jgi:hypothetical protein